MAIQNPQTQTPMTTGKYKMTEKKKSILEYSGSPRSYSDGIKVPV